MKDGYKIVCNTASGRRGYMKFLIPYVLASDIVDRYDIWVHTDNKQDLAFFMELAKRYSKINLIYQPDNILDGMSSINAFYKYCVEPDTIYLKLDDDIIWMEPYAIEKIIDFRIKNPKYFLVSPLVINNGISTFILQEKKKLRMNREIEASIKNIGSGWCSPQFAYTMHKWFWAKIKDNTYKELHSGEAVIAMNHFSINSVCWFGRVFAQFDGEVKGWDEPYLTVKKTLELNLSNCFYTDAIMVHFAFSKQKKYLDTTSILNDYAALTPEYYTINELQIFNDISAIISNIDTNPMLYPVSCKYIRVAHKGLYKKLRRMVFERICKKIESNYRLNEITDFSDKVSKNHRI